METEAGKHLNSVNVLKPPMKSNTIPLGAVTQKPGRETMAIRSFVTAGFHGNRKSARIKRHRIFVSRVEKPAPQGVTAMKIAPRKWKYRRLDSKPESFFAFRD
jgi:hypothetical protein